MTDATEIFLQKTAQQMDEQPDTHSGLCLTLNDAGLLSVRSMDDQKKQVLVNGLLGSKGC